MTKEDIKAEMQKVTEGVVDVIVYPSASDKSKNRGFAFVEYESHRSAAMARRKLMNSRIQLWGHHIAVDWAEPELEVDEEIMAQVGDVTLWVIVWLGGCYVPEQLLLLWNMVPVCACGCMQLETYSMCGFLGRLFPCFKMYTVVSKH